jgi:hypothetical protein
MGGEGIDVKNGSSNGIVSDNIVHNMGLIKPAIYVDGYSGTSSNIEVCRNEVYNIGAGIVVTSEKVGGVLQNCNVHHNTIHDITGDDPWGIVIGWPDGGAIDDLIINANTVSGLGVGGNSLLIANALATDVTVTNNVWDAVNGNPMYASAWVQGEFTITGNTPNNTVVTP